MRLCAPSGAWGVTSPIISHRYNNDSTYSIECVISLASIASFLVVFAVRSDKRRCTWVTALLFAVAVLYAVSSGRLMFTFQYANTAGLFYAVTATILLCSSSRRRRVLAAAPIVALLLTQSIGVIGVFLVGLAVVGANRVALEGWSRTRFIAVVVHFSYCGVRRRSSRRICRYRFVERVSGKLCS